MSLDEATESTRLGTGLASPLPLRNVSGVARTGTSSTRETRDPEL